jgi:hypothetical protein
MQAIRAIIREELPRLSYIGLFQYNIQAVNGSPPNVTIDALPTDDSLGLPPLSNISCQPDLSGITSIPDDGINCVVAFLNADPTKPVVVGVDSLEAWRPNYFVSSANPSYSRHDRRRPIHRHYTDRKSYHRPDHARQR